MTTSTHTTSQRQHHKFKSQQTEQTNKQQSTKQTNKTKSKHNKPQVIYKQHKQPNNNTNVTTLLNKSNKQTITPAYAKQTKPNQTITNKQKQI